MSPFSAFEIDQMCLKFVCDCKQTTTIMTRINLTVIPLAASNINSLNTFYNLNPRLI